MPALSSEKYKKRPSPPYHARDYPGKTKKGNDGQYYVSKKGKRGIYRWVLKDPNEPKRKPYRGGVVILGDDLKYEATKDQQGNWYWKKVLIKYKTNPRDYYDQFLLKPTYDTTFVTSKLPDLKRELRKAGVTLYFIKWNKYSPTPFEYEYWLEDNRPEGSYIYFSHKMLYLSSTLKEGVLYIQHHLEKEVVERFNRAFTSFFPRRTRGYMNERDAIKLFLFDQKSFRGDQRKVVYEVTIYFKEKISKRFSPRVVSLNKSIGYLYEWDEAVIDGKVQCTFNVNYDKVVEFTRFIEKLGQNEEIRKVGVKRVQ